ncbi:hypothetical protein BAA08_10830 [Bizionia sp. APA-3]|nr:hypothetical protein BAA08_10830 [Bizionia sp. APA-3]
MYVNILAFFKYVFPIVLFIYFSKFPIQNKNKLFRVFEAIIIFNCLLIVVGFVFGVPYFKTYLGPRFGYNGLLYSSSLTSYVYIIVLFYFLMKYKIHFFSNWKTLLVIISALLVGTKTIYLALLFISILYLVNYSQFKYKYALAMLIPIVGILAGYFLFFKWGFFNELRQSEGVFSSILSFRNQLFLNDTLPYIKENWSWINYCFGGVADFRTKSEMGFIDVFYFFGTMGGAVFLYTYWRSFFTFSPIRLVWIFSGFLGIIIFISGNYFIYTTIPLFLVVLREKLMLKT